MAAPDVYNTVRDKFMFNFDLNREQISVIETVLNKDVFSVLPTGYGSSACYI
jgi:superfamily II DNA helicase RecQ